MKLNGESHYKNEVSCRKLSVLKTASSEKVAFVTANFKKYGCLKSRGSEEVGYSRSIGSTVLFVAN